MNARESPVALITGAGSGIGRATACLLGTHGYRVVLAGRREAPLQETARGLPTAATPRVKVADVGDPRQARALVDHTVHEFGRLDVLVNNAGEASLHAIGETTTDILDRSYRVNALGPANAIAAAWPVFARQNSGCIVNVSTIGTLDPFPGFFAYASAKAAMNVMVRSCATEGRAIGVRAFAVAPGAVETAMLRANFDEKRVPSASCLAPDDVARVILECVTGARDAENGRVIVVSRRPVTPDAS
jgi:NAD(P)-dependent dehydrogenase (short-subunit alcohol dehydrogenase family)